MSYFDRYTVEEGTMVYDVENCRELKCVRSIDTRTGVVIMYVQPLMVVDGELQAYPVFFDTIHPIYAGSTMPCLFHCYGSKK